MICADLKVSVPSGTKVLSQISSALFLTIFIFLGLRFPSLVTKQAFSAACTLTPRSTGTMGSHDKPTSDHDDEACIEVQKPAQEGVDDYVPDTEEERKLVRKIDIFLLPAIWGMYLLSYMVRTMCVRLQL